MKPRLLLNGQRASNAVYPDSYCFIHDKVELVDDDTYLVCMECGHAYQRESDIIDLDINTREGIVKVTKRDRWAVGAVDIDTSPRIIDEILFCPLCLHDW